MLHQRPAVISRCTTTPACMPPPRDCRRPLRQITCRRPIAPGTMGAEPHLSISPARAARWPAAPRRSLGWLSPHMVRRSSSPSSVTRCLLRTAGTRMRAEASSCAHPLEPDPLGWLNQPRSVAALSCRPARFRASPLTSFCSPGSEFMCNPVLLALLGLAAGCGAPLAPAGLLAPADPNLATRWRPPASPTAGLKHYEPVDARSGWGGAPTSSTQPAPKSMPGMPMSGMSMPGIGGK